MPYHIMSVPCLRVINDQGTGLPSLMDIVESATIEEGGKLSIPPFKLYSKWGRDNLEEEDNFDLKVSFDGPALSKKVQVDLFLVEFPKNVNGLSIVMDVPEIEVDELGMVKLHVDWKPATPKAKWRKAATIPIYLKRRSQAKGD